MIRKPFFLHRPWRDGAILCLSLAIAGCWTTDGSRAEPPNPPLSQAQIDKVEARIDAAFTLFKKDVYPGALASGRAFPAFNAWQSEIRSAVRAGMKTEALSEFTGFGVPSSAATLKQTCKDADAELATFRPDYPPTMDLLLLAALKEGWTPCGLTRSLLYRTEDLTSDERTLAADRIGKNAPLRAR